MTNQTLDFLSNQTQSHDETRFDSMKCTMSPGERDTILTKVKSVLNATKHPMTAKEISKLYKEDWSTELPLSDLGYTSVEELLKSMCDDVDVQVKNDVSYFVKKSLPECPMQKVREMVRRTADDTDVQKKHTKPVKEDRRPPKTYSAASSSTSSYPFTERIHPGISPSSTRMSESSEPRFTRDAFLRSVLSSAPVTFAQLATDLHDIFKVSIYDVDLMNRVMGTRQHSPETAINEAFQGLLKVVYENGNFWVKIASHHPRSLDSWMTPDHNKELGSEFGVRDIYDDYVEHLLSFMVKGVVFYSGNVPKVLSKQFHFDDDGIYDENLLTFVENLVSRSEGKMKLKFINNLAFIELAEDRKGHDYVNHQVVQCDSLMQILDKALLETTIDDFPHDRDEAETENTSKTIDASEFQAFAEAYQPKEDQCSIM
ncbi:hypothetical protein L596_004491 [Steinernema carpocapsae]|uniref:HTH OST-type domain-containing protein n=1 Tax=Steinernema carpocapsae TaxID=34508 RepID=A0A4U8UVZ4_STECR|nr:hypothetical protein L596_004491 [Steinernema carpocapsae]